MSKIYDYNTFANKKVKSFDTNMSFSSEVRELDIDLYNLPKGLGQVSSVECDIEYSVSVVTSKTGIQTIDFLVDSMELELTLDKHPDEEEELEFDIVPGKTTAPEAIECQKRNHLIPTNPTRVEINMAGSANPKDFKVIVFFGRD